MDRRMDKLVVLLCVCVGGGCPTAENYTARKKNQARSI